MGMLKKLMPLFILALLLTGCSDIEALTTLIPKFSSELPNVFSGTYAYYESEEDKEKREATYIYKFDAVSQSVIKTERSDNGTGSEMEVKGTYSYSYEKFDITRASGYLTINLRRNVMENGEKKKDEGGNEIYYIDSSTFGFLFEGTAEKGASTLQLGSQTLYCEGE